MYRSGEIRWFLRGESPRDMHRWFDAGGLERSEAERTDEYLLLPGCETASVKLREGRFEVKACTKAPARVDYSHELSGFRDTWVKWSSNTGDVERFREQFIRAEDDWIKVTKKRRLRLISLESATPLEIGYGGTWLSRGCQVELTDIEVRHVGAEKWWSLSFESFGNRETLLASLDLVVPDFFAEAPPVSLGIESSFSYPAWLNHLQQEEQG